MHSYHYTNKLLFILAVCNLWMVIASVWSELFPIELIRMTQGDTLPQWINFLLSGIQWYLILGMTTWAFFKRLYWVAIPYLIYLSYNISLFILGAIQNRKDLLMGKFVVKDNFLGTLMNLGSIADNFSYILLWFLTLITVIVILIETNYSDLYNRWRKWLTG